MTSLHPLIVIILCLFSFNVLSDSRHAIKKFSVSSGDEMRVLVSLKVPKQKMSSAGGGGWVNFTDYIDAVQRKAVSQLGWQNFNDVVRYKTQATLAKSVTKSQFKALLRANEVEAVYKDEFRPVMLQSSLGQIGMKNISRQSPKGNGVAVAVLDTGIDSTHAFFENKVVGEACFSQMGSCPNDLRYMEGKGAGMPCKGDCSHGTHVGGIVAGYSHEMSGVAKSADLLAVQVFSVDGNAIGSLDSDVLSGLEWVYLNSKKYNVKAVNMSLGGGAFAKDCDFLAPYKTMFDLLAQADIAVIVASGNEYLTQQIAAPSCISKAISVGSLDKYNQISPFSNSNDQLDILAPGGDILSAVPGGRFEAMSGTSMAAPHVAGAWAVLASMYPSASLLEIEASMKRGADHYRDPRNKLMFPVLRLDKAADWLAKTYPQTPERSERPNRGRQPVEGERAKGRERPNRIDGIRMEGQSDEPEKMRW
jgi:subtilisin family serine protease